MKHTYRHYRNFRIKQQRNKRRAYIPMSKWIEEIKKSEGHEMSTYLLEKNKETEGIPEDCTTEEVKYYIDKLKSRLVPGCDQVPPELYKIIPENMLIKVTEIINTAWKLNIFPSEWLTTKQVPIPKNKNPKTVNDYRRISICNVGYRIYGNFLLDKLDNEIKSLGNYQAAFLVNRSTEDHIFTLRRVLEEEWRCDKKFT